mmetsp:Transcript_21417/g.55849  ORF Transcript_21417/g.55849 Transcript_21417/m.55849 type:complete len:424 (+) Transcript_21417:703-1974(+)
MARPLQSGARGGGKHPGLALVHLERAALRLLQLAHDRLADQGVVRGRPLHALGHGPLAEDAPEVGEDVVRHGRGDQGVAQGARMPVVLERLLPSLVPRNRNQLCSASAHGDGVEGVAGSLEGRRHSRLLEPDVSRRHALVGVLLEPITLAGPQLPTEPVDLCVGDELFGEIPLVRLVLALVRMPGLFVLPGHGRIARIAPDIAAPGLPMPVLQQGVEGNVAVREREDHRAAPHGGCLFEEVVALAGGILEVVPLPAQSVYPLARAARQATGTEGHLPKTASRPLAHLEVESQFLEGQLQHALELEWPALVHEVVVASGHGRTEGREHKGPVLLKLLKQPLLQSPALVAGREGTEDTLQYLFALLRPHVLKLVNGGLYDFVRMGGDLEARCQSRCGSKQDGLAHGGHDPRATARTIAVSACVCK